MLCCAGAVLWLSWWCGVGQLSPLPALLSNTQMKMDEVSKRFKDLCKLQVLCVTDRC